MLITDSNLVEFSEGLKDRIDGMLSPIQDKLVTLEELVAGAAVQPKSIVEISPASSALHVLMSDGTLWGAGFNYYGQLGLGDTASSHSLLSLLPISDVQSVRSLGESATIIRKNDGTLWGAGRNNLNQLDAADTNNKTSFVQLAYNLGSPITDFWTGFNFVAVLLENGELWAIGQNEEGQFGQGNINNYSTFVKCPITDIKKVWVGLYNLWILKNDNTLWATGRAGSGQLGIGNTAAKVSTFTEIAVTDVKEIYPHSDCATFLIKNDGTLWSAGMNIYGTLGIGNTTSQKTFVQVPISDIKLFAFCNADALVLKNDGTLWGTGMNYRGELGLGDTAIRTSFTQIDIADVRLIGMGFYNSYVVKNDGTLWTVGDNQYGQLSVGDTVNRSTFTLASKVTPTDSF